MPTRTLMPFSESTKPSGNWVIQIQKDQKRNLSPCAARDAIMIPRHIFLVTPVSSALQAPTRPSTHTHTHTHTQMGTYNSLQLCRLRGNCLSTPAPQEFLPPHPSLLILFLPPRKRQPFVCTQSSALTPSHFSVGFLDGTVVKNLPAKAGNAGDEGLIPGSGRSPREGNGNPLQFLA